MTAPTPNAALRAALQQIIAHGAELKTPGDYARGWNDARFRIRQIAETALSAIPPEQDGYAEGRGMKQWHGGDAAPDDWDGGPVLRRDGATEHSDDITKQQWQCPVPRCKWNIVAYTPASPPNATPTDRHAEGRIAGLEEAAKVAEGYVPRFGLPPLDTRAKIATAIRAIAKAGQS